MKWTYARDLLAPDEAAAKPLPMWVADTDKAPPVVLKALHESVDHGVFGYPAGRDGELPRRGDRLAGKTVRLVTYRASGCSIAPASSRP